MKMMDSDLKDKAACKGSSTEIFFADSGPISDRTVKANILKAKALCKKCEIQVECLMNAINNGEEFGIWGGLTGKERQKIFSEVSEIDYDQAFETVIWTRNT